MNISSLLAGPPPEFPCPVTKGEWVIKKDGMHPEFGRVKECYWDGCCKEWVMDVVLYSPEGERIGRTSPAMGGPRHFEPAVPVEYWQRIQKPTFPLERDKTGYRDWRSATVPLAPQTVSVD